MDSKCDNANCPMATANTSAPKLLLCLGCSTAKYCSSDCQKASWSSHKKACKLHPPSHLRGISVRVVQKEARAN
ncbi:hypothetical protein C8R47DRAFT_1100950 [Mycena vitilis]|nr:hypothetical protein C8R47DRAFT_1100950 [Mycena vitilis]